MFTDLLRKNMVMRLHREYQNYTLSDLVKNTCNSKNTAFCLMESINRNIHVNCGNKRQNKRNIIENVCMYVETLGNQIFQAIKYFI